MEVLYDDLMVKQVGNLTKSSIGATGNEGREKLLYSDINGRPLQLPPLVFPFRRAIYLVSKTAYKSAMDNIRRPHECAKASSPSDSRWTEIYELVKEESEEFDDGTEATA